MSVKILVDVDVLEELLDICDPEGRYDHPHLSDGVEGELRADIERARRVR